MAKQTINIGSGLNEGDGGPTRLAFEKINSNFSELYDLAIENSSIAKDINGSVFADDSTLLVDGVNGVITGDVENGRVITGIINTENDDNLYVYAGGFGSVILAGQSDVSIGHTSGQVDVYGDVEFNDGTTAFQSGNSVDFNCAVDFTGATITMPQYINVTDLKALVAASTDFTDFQARIAAL